MRVAANIVGGLLALVFVVLPSMLLLGIITMPPIPPNSPAEYFAKAFGPTGYMTFVLIMEIIGGLLVGIPRTRNLGLLILGPIIINILVYHICIMKGEGLVGPPLLVAFCAAFLLLTERKSFGALIHSRLT